MFHAHGCLAASVAHVTAYHGTSTRSFKAASAAQAVHVLCSYLHLTVTFHHHGQAPADGTFTYVNGDATGAGFSMFSSGNWLGWC